MLSTELRNCIGLVLASLVSAEILQRSASLTLLVYAIANEILQSCLLLGHGSVAA